MNPTRTRSFAPSTRPALSAVMATDAPAVVWKSLRVMRVTAGSGRVGTRSNYPQAGHMSINSSTSIAFGLLKIPAERRCLGGCRPTAGRRVDRPVDVVDRPVRDHRVEPADAGAAKAELCFGLVNW